MFCEEFQTSLLVEHHKVFDNFKNKSKLFGELVWNFADFMTDQGKYKYKLFSQINISINKVFKILNKGLIRAYGNHKGLFTDHRQPKESAFLIKDRYNSMKKP